MGSPFPMIGATPNLHGDTSVLYAGIAYERSLSNGWTDGLTYNLTKALFISGGVSAALHNGPLHKDPIGCRRTSDCGFGYRVLPRLNIELGQYFRSKHGVSFFYDHMSHKGVLPGENEGIDHLGIRYHFIFNQPRS
jgi:lipid A 3-O-deacylase